MIKRTSQPLCVWFLATDLALTALAWVGAYELRFVSGWLPLFKETPDFYLCWRNLPLVLVLSAVGYHLAGMYSIHRLRRFRLVARTLTVRLIHVDTRPPALKFSGPPRDNEQAGTSERARTLLHPTDATVELAQRARELLRELPRKRALVKRVGLTFRPTRTVSWDHRKLGGVY